MHFLKPLTFILLSATHLLVMWKNKSMLVLMAFPLLNELSHFIYETNPVHYRASGKWEKEIHTENQKSGLASPLYPSSGLLLSLPQCRMMFLCLSGGTCLFLSPGSARQESASLESPASWVGDSFCCYRLHSCPAWSDYWHLHVCGDAASHGLYWPRNTSYSFLFPARHSSSPMGPAPLAGTPKSSVDALADPFP